MARLHVIHEGHHSIDATDLEGQLVDLIQGGRRGLRTELEGSAEARAELLTSAEGHRTDAASTRACSRTSRCAPSGWRASTRS